MAAPGLRPPPSTGSGEGESERRSAEVLLFSLMVFSCRFALDGSEALHFPVRGRYRPIGRIGTRRGAADRQCLAEAHERRVCEANTRIGNALF